MIVLRSALFALLLALSSVLYFPFALAAVGLDPLRRNHFIGLWAHFILWLSRWLLGIRYRVEGRENLPPGPAVILSKHQSAWETIAYQALFPPLCYVLKRELLRIPFFGWGLALTRPIAIDRSAGREALRQVEEEGRARLAEGLWVVIFPEGRRMPPGTKGAYHIGGAWLAARAGVPVVPVAHNAGRLWGKNAFIKRPGLVSVRIGPAISTAGRKPAQINAEAEAWIERAMQDL